MKPKVVLVCHQSAELYGSDRSLLELLQGLSGDEYKFLVCLPEDGPLKTALEVNGLEVHVIPLVKVSRKLFSIRGLAGLPLNIFRSVNALSNIVGDRHISFVYTNTLAVLGGVFWAVLKGRPHVWHVREIIRKPRLVSAVFRMLVNHFAARVICNSRETLLWMTKGKRDSNGRANVVWNGVEIPDLPGPIADRRERKYALGIPADCPMILMVGRVNNWKGQDVLVEALQHLADQDGAEFSVVFVGGPPPGQPELMTELKDRINGSSIRSVAHVFEFTTSIEQFYIAADLLVVPSKEPEPFGRVAIEAMAVGLPVIASAHGGLTEIVENERTGLLVTPSDSQALASAIGKLLHDESRREAMGQAGRIRQQMNFSLDAYRSGVKKIFDSLDQEVMKS